VGIRPLALPSASSLPKIYPNVLHFGDPLLFLLIRELGSADCKRLYFFFLLVEIIVQIVVSFHLFYSGATDM
jgi:hypothetical protein